MIRSLEICNPTKAFLPYLAQIAAFSTPRKFDFKPGLNILWGPNGSGKSTVLKLLSQLLHCSQGGKTVLTRTSISTVCDELEIEARLQHLRELLTSVVIDHDGQSTRYFDPSQAVGLAFGGSAFDYDFMGEGMRNVGYKPKPKQTKEKRTP